MEDLVAVEVTTNDGHTCYFITWGRIQSAVDPAPLERLIMKVASHFAIGSEPASARLCWSLSDARDAPYFYEALWSFSQKPIPFGPGYEKWRKRMNRRMREGREIYFVGPFAPKTERDEGSISFGMSLATLPRPRYRPGRSEDHEQEHSHAEHEPPDEGGWSADIRQRE